MYKRMFKQAGLAIAVLALVAACGGGGGDAGDSPFGSGGSGSGSSGDGGSSGTGGGGSAPGGGISDVSTNLPSQKSISISAEKYALDWSVDGDTTTITVRVTDTAGNPVPEGSVVQFFTEGGQIQTSCRLTGATSGASNISACSVTFATQNRRPSDSYVSVLAWLEGEEAYVDLNGSGRYDAGEPFWDAGRLFRDDNENATYDSGIDELNLGSSASGALGIGTSTCVQPGSTYDSYLNSNSVPLSVPDTCDGVWGRSIIRTRTILPVSDPRVMGLEDASTAGAARVRLFAQYGTRRTAAPAGTALSVQGVPSGCTISVSPAQVSDGDIVPTEHRLSGAGTCSGANVTVVAKFKSYEVNTVVTMP